MTLLRRKTKYLELQLTAPKQNQGQMLKKTQKEESQLRTEEKLGPQTL